jgi:hypothetical protein
MKQCAKCKEVKDIVYFYKHNNTKDKLNPYCKECQKAVSNRHHPKYNKQSMYFEWDVKNVTI